MYTVGGMRKELWKYEGMKSDIKGVKILNDKERKKIYLEWRQSHSRKSHSLLLLLI